MAKDKKCLKEEKKKVPFNVFRKGAMALALAGIVASPFMLTGCSGEKGDTGEQGVQGEQGIQGEQGRGVVDMDIVYEYDDNGNLWAVYTITYSDGETEIVKTLVPKRMKELRRICLSNNQTVEKFVKVADAESTPKLYAEIVFDDESTGKIELTNDMFTVDQDRGLSIPDFTTKGTYQYEISYRTKTSIGDIEIVELEDYSASTVNYVSVVDQYVVTGTPLKDIIVNINYDGTINVNTSLSVVASKYLPLRLSSSLDTIDTSLTGQYNIKLKDQFKFTGSQGEIDTIGTLCLYEKSCTINDFTFDEFTLSYGDEDFEDVLKEVTFEASLFEPNEKGEMSFTGKVKDLNYDLTNFDINRVGTHFVPFTYQLEGQTGVYKDYIEVTVEASLGTLLKTYSVDAVTMGMFTRTYGDTIKLYNNGIAVISTASEPEYTSQANYELLAGGTVLKIYDDMMNTYAYYDVDDANEEVSFYTGATGTPTNYTGQIEMLGDPYDVIVSIYGSTGICKGKIVIKADMGSGLQEIPYSFVDCEWVDSDTIKFAGRTFNVTTGNVLVEVK